LNIKILGTGCPSCKKLHKSAVDAAKEMNIDATFEKVEDFPSIMAYGVMRTPALVINEKVKVFGRIPSIDEIKAFIIAEK